MENVYLKVNEIAKMTGINPDTVRKWCRSGGLKSYKPGGKDLLIKRSDFDQFMESKASKEV